MAIGACLALVVLSSCSSGSESSATTAADTAAPTTSAPVVDGPTAKVAFFYHPPDDAAETPLVAEKVQWLAYHYDDAPDRDALRQNGFDHPIYLYLLSMQTKAEHFDNNAFWADRSDPGNPSSAYFDDQLKMHPDWFLRDQYGQFITGSSYWMDPASPGWRTFLAAQVKSVMGNGQWDGVFLDNVAVTFKRPLRDAGDNDTPSGADKGDPVPWDYATNQPYTNETFGDAVAGMVQTVRDQATAPTGTALWANLTDTTTAYPDQREKYLPLLDGWMDEGFASTFEDTSYPEPEKWDTMMDRAELPDAVGKGRVFVGQGPADDHDLMRFTFASYLLLADDQSYFRYADTDEYRTLRWYPEYDLDFGRPLGPRKKQADGTWTREFSKGSVVVDPVHDTVVLTVDGQPV